MVKRSDSILIVDDVGSMRMLLTSMLRTLGYENIGEAFDGSNALEKIQRHHYDVVFLDISMPGKDGLQVLSEIRAERPNIFIVMQTGSASKENVEASMEHGVQDFIAKPYNLNQVKRAMSIYRQQSK